MCMRTFYRFDQMTPSQKSFIIPVPKLIRLITQEWKFGHLKFRLVGMRPKIY